MKIGRRRLLLYSLVRFGGARYLLPWNCDHVHQPPAAGRLAPGRRDRGDHGRDRRIVCAATAQEIAGTKRIAHSREAVLEGRRASSPAATVGRSRSMARPIKTPAREALVVPTEAARGGHRRRVAECARNHRSAGHAADRACECGDRPRGAGPPRFRERPLALRRSRPCLLSRRRTQCARRSADGRMGQASGVGATTVRCGLQDDDRFDARCAARRHGRAAEPRCRIRSIPSSSPVFLRW